MLKYLLIHPFRDPNDGAFIRVKNLNSVIAEITSADSREIILVSLRHFRSIFDNDSASHIFKRRIILPILWTNRHFIARTWNRISSNLVGMILAVLFRPDIIVGETSASWRLAQAIKAWRPRSKLITDLHGASPEELLFHYPASKKLEIASKEETELERDIVLNSDFITCQSANMIEHLKIKYPDTKTRFHSFQCSVRSELFQYNQDLRSNYRQKLVLKEDETLFVYSGSFHKWQNVRYSVEMFSEYLKISGTSAKLLIMSPSPGDELIGYAYSLGLNENNFKILKVPHEEVSVYLNAADIGFLIRDDSVVNRVASPTKLGEYLACGLPVIAGAVAHSWPAAKLDESCFCFVDLEDAKDAAYSIMQFLQAWNRNPAESKKSAAALATLTLSNQKEIEGLNGFISKNILERKH